MKRTALAVAAIALLTLPTTARADVKIGMLDCEVASGIGQVLTSSKEATCTFHPLGRGRPTAYFGTVRKYGLDIGVTRHGVMQWLVFAPTRNAREPGALAGNYVGATAGASIGVGGAAHVLVGGSRRSFTLQPISLQADIGLNLAVGVEDFRLRVAK
jgi:hypothetical protein